MFWNSLSKHPLLSEYFKIRCKDFPSRIKLNFPKIKLYSLNKPGRAEPIRMLLRAAKVRFKEKQLTK